MDKRKIIRTKLNAIFCELRKEDKRYLEVWLSDVDFGEFYRPDKFVLNIRVAHIICNS